MADTVTYSTSKLSIEGVPTTWERIHSPSDLILSIKAEQTPGDVSVIYLHVDRAKIAKISEPLRILANTQDFIELDELVVDDVPVIKINEVKPAIMEIIFRVLDYEDRVARVKASMDDSISLKHAGLNDGLGDGKYSKGASQSNEGARYNKSEDLAKAKGGASILSQLSVDELKVHMDLPAKELWDLVWTAQRLLIAPQNLRRWFSEWVTHNRRRGMQYPRSPGYSSSCLQPLMYPSYYLDHAWLFSYATDKVVYGHAGDISEESIHGSHEYHRPLGHYHNPHKCSYAVQPRDRLHLDHSFIGMSQLQPTLK